MGSCISAAAESALPPQDLQVRKIKTGEDWKKARRPPSTDQAASKSGHQQQQQCNSAYELHQRRCRASIFMQGILRGKNWAITRSSMLVTTNKQNTIKLFKRWDPVKEKKN